MKRRLPPRTCPIPLAPFAAPAADRRCPDQKVFCARAGHVILQTVESKTSGEIREFANYAEFDQTLEQAPRRARSDNPALRAIRVGATHRRQAAVRPPAPAPPQFWRNRHHDIGPAGQLSTRAVRLRPRPYRLVRAAWDQSPGRGRRPVGPRRKAGLSRAEKEWRGLSPTQAPGEDEIGCPFKRGSRLPDPEYVQIRRSQLVQRPSPGRRLRPPRAPLKPDRIERSRPRSTARRPDPSAPRSGSAVARFRHRRCN